MSGQSAQPNINFEEIKAIDISLPPLPEQTAIASILSSLDDKIDLLHRQNKTLEQLAETLFRRWFVDETEESWEEVTLGQFVKTNLRSISKDYEFNEIEYLDTSSLTKGIINETQKLILKNAPSRAKRLVQNNDILLYHRGLRSLVALELKIGAFKPEYAGKMNFYLGLLDKLEKQTDENPSIGIILCADKDHLDVEIALQDIGKPIGIAEYKLLLPTKELEAMLLTEMEKFNNEKETEHE